jgi:CheY-like chemotaxis protein
LADALGVLERSLPTCFMPTLSMAIAHYPTDALPPDLLVLLQSRSGQFLETELLRLRSCMPLARAVVVLGSWCEGEMRSGRPLAGVRRVAWNAWPLRLERELAAWHYGGGIWSLPATAGEEELVLEADGLPEVPHARVRSLPVAIRTGSTLFGGCLVESLTRHGQEAVCLPISECAAPEHFSALVDDLRLPADGGELASGYRIWQPRPILALADFPRPRDEQLVREAGASMLLAKPVDLDELAAHLSRLLAI